jgi:hypothetical protein
MATTTYTIGTDTTANVQLKGQGIEALHARVLIEDDTLFMEDLNTTTGTYINDLRFHKAIVKKTDTVKLGSTPVVLEAYFEWDEKGLPIKPRDPNDYSQIFKERVALFEEYQEARRLIQRGSKFGMVAGIIPYLGPLLRGVQGHSKIDKLTALDQHIKNNFVCPKCEKPWLMWLSYTPTLLRKEKQCPHRCGANFNYETVQL